MASSGMVDTKARSLYRKQLKDRMKASRENAGLSQSEMGLSLRIGLDAYKKMEQRGALPIDLVEPFAHICRVDPCFVLTGRQPTPAKMATVPDEPPRIRARR